MNEGRRIKIEVRSEELRAKSEPEASDCSRSLHLRTFMPISCFPIFQSCFVVTWLPQIVWTYSTPPQKVNAYWAYISPVNIKWAIISGVAYIKPMGDGSTRSVWNRCYSSGDLAWERLHFLFSAWLYLCNYFMWFYWQIHFFALTLHSNFHKFNFGR